MCSYKELVNVDENTNKGRFNYLVGKLSATMDAVLPRASVANELVKKIKGEISDNKTVSMDENEVISGLWDTGKSAVNSESKENVENSRLESVEKYSGNGIMNAVALSKYVNSSDPLYINATKIKPISNYEDMVIHGDAFGFQINNKDGKPIDNYNAVEFANILKEDPNYHGGNIRLVSCETGSA